VGVVPDVTDFGILQVLSAAAYSRGFADRGDRTRVDLWMPLQPDPESFPRETHPIFLLGRLGPGATVASAQQELSAIAADLERTYPENDGRGVFVERLGEVVFGPARPALLVLVVAVALVLLVACANVANLILARGATRGREVAIRGALGATNGRLARQFLVENLVLTAIAALAGIGLAYLGLRSLLALAPPDVPRLSTVTIDARVLLATLGVSLAVALVFGMTPFLQSLRVDVLAALKNEGGTRASASREGIRLRSALVVVEVSLAVVLVVGAGLLIRTFWNLQRVDPGFRAAGVLKAEYQLPATRYPVDFRVWPNFKEIHAFTQKVLERASGLPGVTAAAVAGNHPLDAGFTNSFVVVGREAEAETWPEISVRRVTPGYFRTVGLSLRRGRLLADSDGTAAAPVLLINDAAARRFFGDRDPLGARIRFWGASRTVVGVVANEQFHGLTETAPLAVYLPFAQAPSATGGGVLIVRTAGDPMALASAVRGAIRDVDPALAVFGVEPLQETVARSVGRQRFTMLLLVVFAGVALVLAAIGIHGILAYSVAQRTREIGIRVALGAEPSRVLGRVVGQGLLLAAAGLVVGLAAAMLVTRFLASLLFGVGTTDPATFALVAACLAAVALGASYVPARRATAVDPAVALRSE
jgi:putative ABC transport system permease protein